VIVKWHKRAHVQWPDAATSEASENSK